MQMYVKGGSRLEIPCFKGMYRLKVVSSEKKKN